MQKSLLYVFNIMKLPSGLMFEWIVPAVVFTERNGRALDDSLFFKRSTTSSSIQIFVDKVKRNTETKLSLIHAISEVIILSFLNCHSIMCI